MSSSLPTRPTQERRRSPWFRATSGTPSCPGPSKPGATLKDPLQLGVTTDGNKGLFQVPEAHTQVMGMSGSGKSVGFTWNFVAELITRKSRAGRTELWGIDIAKGRQTLG